MLQSLSKGTWKCVQFFILSKSFIIIGASVVSVDTSEYELVVSFFLVVGLVTLFLYLCWP
jgi:hypothetical protein